MLIFGARNFRSRRAQNEKSAPKTGAGKWSRFSLALFAVNDFKCGRTHEKTTTYGTYVDAR